MHNCYTQFSKLLAFGLLLVIISALAHADDSAAQDIKGEFVTVNGAQLWYAIEGKGPPLVLIAGGPGASHRYLYPWFSELATTQRLVYFDAFGRGKSGRANSVAEYTFERDVEDLEGLRKTLKLGKINLLGHSYGSMVAQRYALKYPDSINKLILSNSLIGADAWRGGADSINDAVARQFPEQWEQLLSVRAKGFRSSSKEHQEVFFQVPVFAVAYVADPAKASRWSWEGDAWNPDVYYAIAGDDADFVAGGDIAKLDFSSQLKQLKMPSLVIASRYDRAVPPAFSLQYKHFMPQAQFVMLDDVGHQWFGEAPAQGMDVLRKFLTE